MRAAALQTDETQNPVPTGPDELCTQLGGRRVGDACVIPEADSTTKFRYLPLRCDIQRNDNGAAMLSLIEFGSGAFLNATTIWDLPAAEIEALRATLAAELPGPDRPPIKLSFYRAKVSAAEFAIARAEDEPLVLATSSTSSSPPYSALYSINLDAAQTENIKQALSGSEGVARVTYRIELVGPEQAIGARVNGDPSTIFDAIRNAGDDASIDDDAWLRELVTDAVRDGHLQLSLVIGDDAPDALLADLEARLVDLIIDWIRENAADEGIREHYALLLETELRYRTETHWNPASDLATWTAQDDAGTERD